MVARANAEVLDSEDAQLWQEELRRGEAESANASKKLVEAGIATADTYNALVVRAGEIEDDIARLEQRVLEAGRIEADALGALERYRTRRGQLSAKRQTFAETSSGEHVKIEIRQYQNHVKLSDTIRALVSERFEGDRHRLATEISSGSGNWSYDTLDDAVSRLRGMSSGSPAGLDVADQRFVAMLRQLAPENFDRLALYAPEDSVRVTFRDAGLTTRASSGGWKELSQGSPGQQTAALLAFVLGYGSEPIILDQPEDDLDNKLIYRLVVRRIRESKSTRQLIIVTHNPNIVVHGDADFVLSLTSAKGQTKVAFRGGLQEQGARLEVCNVMEGGRDAFESRYDRIMARLPASGDAAVAEEILSGD